MLAVACVGTAPEVRRAIHRGDIPNALRLYQTYVSERGEGNADLLADVSLAILARAAGSNDPLERAAGFSALRSLGVRAGTVLEPLAEREGVVGDRATAALRDLDGDNGAPPPRLLAALGSADAERRVAGVSALGAHDGPALIALLTDREPTVRRTVALRLARVHTNLALRALTGCARGDANGGVRASAVAALGQQGPAAATALVGALTDPDIIVRLAAPAALMNASPDDAAEVLSGMVNGEPTDLTLDAARVLAQHNDPRAASFIVDALGSPRPDIRAQAAVAAGVLPDSAMARAAEHLADADPEVALRLAAVLVRHGPYRDRSFAVLHQLAARPDAFIAIRALQALAAVGDATAAVPIREALAVSDPAIRRMAVLAWPDVVSASGNVEPLRPLLTDADRSVALLAAVEIVLIAGR